MTQTKPARVEYDAILLSASPLNGYSAQLVPRKEGATHPVKKIVYQYKELHDQMPFDPLPDHQIYIVAKRQELLDWARSTYGGITAHRIEQFAKTSEVRYIAPLTDLERTTLINKMTELDGKYESLIEKAKSTM